MPAKSKPEECGGGASCFVKNQSAFSSQRIKNILIGDFYLHFLQIMINFFKWRFFMKKILFFVLLCGLNFSFADTVKPEIAKMAVFADNTVFVAGKAVFPKDVKEIKFFDRNGAAESFFSKCSQ